MLGANDYISKLHSTSGFDFVYNCTVTQQEAASLWNHLCRFVSVYRYPLNVIDTLDSGHLTFPNNLTNQIQILVMRQRHTGEYTHMYMICLYSYYLYTYIISSYKCLLTAMIVFIMIFYNEHQGYTRLLDETHWVKISVVLFYFFFAISVTAESCRDKITNSRCKLIIGAMNDWK